MPKHKVRLPDGIELGPVGQDTLRGWFEAGTVKKDTQVQPVGSRRWSRLVDALNIGGWQMPSPAGARSRKGTAGAAASAHAVAEPAERWRMGLAVVLFVLSAGGAFYFDLFPERWLPSLRLAPWREIALGALAMGVALLPGWNWMRVLVQVAVLLLTFVLFPVSGILWVEGVRGAGLLVMVSALVLGVGFFALLGGGRRTWLYSTAALLLVLAGGAGIGYFGLQP